MYHAHFGLERGLFGEGIAADAAVFRSGKHDRLIAHFKLALASPSSSIVLHGPAGVGKTTLTAAALRATSTRLALAWLGGMAANAAELLELILVELGINTLRTTRIERLQLWRQFQGEMRATDSRLFIVAERAEDLSPEVLHALDQLTAPDAAGNLGANLVLLGHASIDEHLAAPLLESLRQRIRFRAELEPFTEAELQDYLRHQVACAGGHFDGVFAPGTVAALHRYSNGVARLANTLCESALDIAAVQRQKQLTADLVAKTAASLLRLAEPAAAPRPAPTPPRVEAASSVEASPAPRPIAPSASAPTPVAAAPAVEPPAAPPKAAPAPIPVVAAAPPPPPPLPTVATAPPPVPSAPTATPPSAPAAAAPAPTVSAPPKPIQVDYDGGATDVADVAVADFPVLTDAVEPTAPAQAPKPAAPTPPKAPAPAASSAPPPAAAAKPAARPMSRVETAYTATRPGLRTLVTPPVPSVPPAAAAQTTAPAAATPASPARGAAAKPAPPAAAPDNDADEARQTQTVRAIAGAKSLDDISEADAETLFGDAELDLVSAALASAADWPDDDEPFTKSAPTPAKPEAKAAPAPAKPQATKAAPPSDDPFDLFGLGDDAPLELIDDSTLPPANPARKTASR